MGHTHGMYIFNSKLEAWHEDVNEKNWHRDFGNHKTVCSVMYKLTYCYQPLHCTHYLHPSRHTSNTDHIEAIITNTISFSLASSNNKEIACPVAILIAVESDPNRVCSIANCLRIKYVYNSD